MNRTLVGITIAVLVMLHATIALGSDHQLTVDGATYTPTKVTGGAVHYETPDTNPQVAFTERHQWTGNGSDNLPCEGGIHWIDNENLLTVSHCLEVPPGSSTTTVPTTTSTLATTTTTTAPTTTTSLSTTTTENQATTTTSLGSTTSTVVTATTTVPQTTTTTPDELPYTGVGELWPFAIAGLTLLALGGLTIHATRKTQ